MSCIHKTKCGFLTFNRPPCSYFLYKCCLIRSCFYFQYLLAYKIIRSHVDSCKFSIHLRSLSFRHFGMVEATRLKSMARSSSSEFHEVCHFVHILLAWPHTRRHTQQDRKVTFIRLLFSSRKESRQIKRINIVTYLYVT
jgi:hypothetical protein